MRNHGGGHKRMYRIIDFKRDKDGVAATVAASSTTEPHVAHRAARIRGRRKALSSLRRSASRSATRSRRRRARHQAGQRDGDPADSGRHDDHNIEFMPGRGGQMVRSAGAGAQLMAKEEKYALLRLPSGEMRRVLIECRATIGQVGNLDHENESWGKAGKSRWLGVTPHTRGVTMNPRDHPHGGGEGKSPVGRKKGPVSATGVLALGFKTRHNKKTDKFIVKRRGGK
jgi:large subunit ribosomal protein L2